MNSSEYAHVIYIATDARTLWKALLEPEFTRRYWGHDNVSDSIPKYFEEKYSNRRTACSSLEVRVAGGRDGTAARSERAR